MSATMIHLIQGSGYLGVFLLMVLESACIPVPSEVIMPFGGYLAWAGHLNIWMVIVLGTLGNVVGSTVAYYVGKIGGRALIHRYGRKLHISERHLNLAESWFAKRGQFTVFVGRLLPGIRTFISLPAGVARMPFGRFVAYSTIGSLPWVAFLALVGYNLGRHWKNIHDYTRPITYMTVVLILGIVVYFVMKVRGATTKRAR